jgi:hypothetical protein
MRLADDTQHTVIVGRNGTGKTQAAVWHLANKNFTEKPWVILDWKRDGLIARIGAKEIDLCAVPTEPGLYIIHPTPDQQEDIDAFLWAIWEQGNVGLYVDEGYMLNKSKAYRAIVTQGRSKRIPTITLSQRPKNMDLFVFSEASFFQIYALNDLNDRKRVAEWIAPEDDNGRVFDPKLRLAKYHSWYYDVNDNELVVLSPVPDANTIVSMFQPKQDELNSSPPQQRIRLI